MPVTKNKKVEIGRIAANEIVSVLEKDQDIQSALVSYYSIGEASSFLPIMRILEQRRSTGGWDPAANAILRNRFLHLQRQLVRRIDLGRELQIGVDRLIHRLKQNHLSDLSSELVSIVGESSELSSLVVANARAMARMRRDFPDGKKRQGTGLN